uniref:Uncharacterized protein n=1 Tax=Aegilops tauschii subsp. strangulata TaxID=200361 RepID=A0A453ABU6_AEGTS
MRYLLSSFASCLLKSFDYDMMLHCLFSLLSPAVVGKISCIIWKAEINCRSPIICRCW